MTGSGGTPSATPNVPGWMTWGTDGSAAEAYAARSNLDHNERVRQRADGSKKRRKHESCQEGTEERIVMHKGPCKHTKTPRRLGVALTWGYLGLAFRLSGCGGRI